MKRLLYAFTALALMSSAASADPALDRFKDAVSEACTKIDTLESGDLKFVMDQAALINRIDRGLLTSKQVTPEVLKMIANGVGLVTDISVLFQISDGKELPNRKLQVKVRRYTGKDLKMSCESGLVFNVEGWFK